MAPITPQGYRMFAIISNMKRSSHPARLSLPRMDVFWSGWVLVEWRFPEFNTLRHMAIYNRLIKWLDAQVGGMTSNSPQRHLNRQKEVPA